MLFMILHEKRKKEAKERKKEKKEEKQGKNMFFGLAPKNWSKVLFSEKTYFHRQKHIIRFKINVLPHFLAFFTSLYIVMQKHKKVYIALRLECAAPKHWSKYTTGI